MNKDDVAHLATLSRIKVSDEECESLLKDMEAIVSYVSDISDISSGDETKIPEIPPLHNVFRSDVIANEADEFTEVLLGEMPYTEGRHMKVQKILKTENE